MENTNGHTGEVPEIQHSQPVSGMYREWFLDYASYVILERAVPANEDGLKPVQRRILHAMKEMDDGRFNKVANLIGSTMQFHPHGDASIGDALVNLGQKDLLIDMQGNWGDIRTGDSAAAPRYIEARLSEFAKEVVFNPQTTEWQLSYDGRKREPVNLPVKFPLLLQQGVEGIAVGLSTKILPHNFCELLKASIGILRQKEVQLLPDFPTGGLADFTHYNEGRKGGKVRVRARIEIKDNKTLLVQEIPFGITTQQLIDSVIKANDQGKIKIKKVVDNTARDIEIEIHIAPGQSPDVAIDALYAFTDCEVSISPNACVIIEDKPHFLGVLDLLKHSTQRTVGLLEKELLIRQAELKEKLLFSSLEKIFIENRIYRDIEECETWEAVLETIDKGLTPYKPDFYRQITQEDLVRLTEIKIKRISRFDTFKADELMRKLQEELQETEHHLANLIAYAVSYFERLLKKYGKGRERRTEIRTFDVITATKVAANNAKLYVNRKEGFVGFGLKKDEFVCDCSDIDDVIVFRKDGTCLVSKISDKVFVGKDIIHVGIFAKNDERMVYNMAYIDGETGISRVKRFQVLAVTRDKEYDLTTGTKGTKVLYFSANPNGEAEVVGVTLSPASKARQKAFDFDFAELDIKGRNSQGNILSKYPVKKIVLKKEGVSTLPAMPLWYDSAIGRLNKEGNGQPLGKFSEGDQILVCYQNGEYELTDYELTNRYDEKSVLLLQKYRPESVLVALYYEGNQQQHFVKRFQIETSTLGKRFSFVGDHPKSKLLFVSTNPAAKLRITFKNGNAPQQEEALELHETTDIKGWRALGQKLSYGKILAVAPLVAASHEDTPEEETTEEMPEEDKDQLKLF